MHPLGEEDDLITKEIIGKAIAIHRVLGPGLLESVYEYFLAHELRKGDLYAEQSASRRDQAPFTNENWVAPRRSRRPRRSIDRIRSGIDGTHSKTRRVLSNDQGCISRYSAMNPKKRPHHRCGLFHLLEALS
jgi:hypothetical protein